MHFLRRIRLRVGRSLRLGEADLVVVHVEDGVEATDEHVAQNPEWTDVRLQAELRVKEWENWMHRQLNAQEAAQTDCLTQLRHLEHVVGACRSGMKVKRASIHSPFSVNALPPSVMVTSGSEGILEQSILYCNRRRVCRDLLKRQANLAVGHRRCTNRLLNLLYDVFWAGEQRRAGVGDSWKLRRVSCAACG